MPDSSLVAGSRTLSIRTYIINLYTTCVRPVSMEFSCQAFSLRLPSRVPKCSGASSKACLFINYISTNSLRLRDLLGKIGHHDLHDRRVDACEKLFKEITTTPAVNMNHHIAFYIYSHENTHERKYALNIRHIAFTIYLKSTYKYV